MDLTAFTSRELHALHAGYNADALVTIAALDIMAPDLHELAGQPHRRAEFHELSTRYSLLLAEAKASQAKGQEIFAEITRRCGMDEAVSNV